MRVLNIFIALLIAGIYLLLLIQYPHLLAEPGELQEGHQYLSKDCFACHTLFQGTPTSKCIVCHSVVSIDSNRVPREQPPFHRFLEDTTCIACHIDHAGFQRSKSMLPFAHHMIEGTVREKCSACHKNPGDRKHKSTPDSCALCHTTSSWKSVKFDHNVLAKDAYCAACHDKPEDGLHRLAAPTCGACHMTSSWKPAQFDHVRYFRFDLDHPNRCDLCHKDDTYETYTCYGCHEHTPSKVRREHAEENISNVENCVQCHRGGDKTDIEQNKAHGRRKRHGRDDDD